MMPFYHLLVGDAFKEMRRVDTGAIQCCVTSPPYYGLRDYGHEDQIGAEQTPEEYVERIVQLGREVRRVLKDDGTFWLNLGDSYYNYRPGAGQMLVKQTVSKTGQDLPVTCHRRGQRMDGLKEKDLIGIPWKCAFALRDDGWYLRSDIIWHKPNPMPESVTDRPTKSHEYIFLLTKNQDYYYDADAIREPHADDWHERASTWRNGNAKQQQRGETYHPFGEAKPFSNPPNPAGRNKRSVWTVGTSPYPEAHFATYPPDLIKPCIMAGSRVGDTILDPCAGRGTTGEVAIELGRNVILIELNPKYAELCRRSVDVTPGLPFI